MRILLTNNSMLYRAGTELYIRDVASEFLRRGHQPVVYSTLLGPVADELRAATIPVVGSLESLAVAPDIIHAHHHYDAMTALLWFPEAPAVYFCHGWLPWEEMPLSFPRVHRYVAVDELCRERLLVEGGVDPDRIDLIFNFFDEARFPLRPPLPPKPGRALVFSNQFAEERDLPIVREACGRLGVELDVMGAGPGNADADPGSRLVGYDLVFAKARAAIEAMAVGAAVVLCNPGRLGPMVDTRNFGDLRRLNFGVRTLDRRLSVDLLMGEVRKYDAADAARVRDLVRSHCELKPAVDRILESYSRASLSARNAPRCAPLDESRAVARYLEKTAPMHKQSALAEDRLRWIRRCAAQEEMAEAGRDAARELDSLKRRTAELEAQEAVQRSRAADLESEATVLKRRASNLEAEARGLRGEIAAMRGSATWRWSQQVLGNALVKRVFGLWIRAVADPSRR